MFDIPERLVQMVHDSGAVSTEQSEAESVEHLYAKCKPQLQMHGLLSLSGSGRPAGLIPARTGMAPDRRRIHTGWY
jgi:hypothetical protein